MKERRLSREVAMQLLYQWELQGLIERKASAVPDFVDHIDMQGFLGHFLHNFYVKDQRTIDMPFIIELINGSLKSIVRIDELIDQSSSKWKLERMEAIDRAILRLSCFELAIKCELGAKVIINEAIEIAKKYGGEQSPAFINGVLDSIKEKIS